MSAPVHEEARSHSVDWPAAAAAVGWNVQPFVDGAYRGSGATELVDDVNPATEEVLCRFPAGEAADVDEAVRVARECFREGSWSGSTPMRRADVLARLADLIVEHAGELALLDCLEMGKPIGDALFDAKEFAPALLRSWAGFADKLLGQAAPISSGTLALNTYEPRGVVGAITPWNFPVVNAVYKIGPALAAGNTVVLKPSELSPSSALRLAELALEAGVPAGAFNVVPGLGATVGEALALHPDVDFIAFTGSTATGRRIMELAGRSNGKPMLLECGGKSPCVVFDDVDDLEAVAESVVQSVLWNQGQVCSAQTRLIVHDDVADSVVDRIVERAALHEPADPLAETTSFGPLASPRQRDRVKAYVTQGLAEGADAVLEGRIQDSGGCYAAPTVFDRVDRTMAIVREEIFGPVLCVQRFSTEAEATELANGTEYGLVATVWTSDVGRGVRLATAIRAGGVYVRSSARERLDWETVLSFEPQKASGFGAEMGVKGLESYSTLKFVDFSGA
jgi:acyl-CoA reductase-like NAD-dependent aldehyde dehydrogenase